MAFKTVNRYEEGDAYSFPLDTGGYGAGVVTRFEPAPRYGSKLVMLAGFHKQFDVAPVLSDLKAFRLVDVVRYGMYRDRRLVDGTWTRLGTQPGYSRKTWPLPLWRSYLLGGVLELDSDHLAQTPSLALAGEIDPSEISMFLLHRGCGTEDGLPAHLELIFQNPNHFQRDRITPKLIHFWEEYRERLRAAGRYPVETMRRPSPRKLLPRVAGPKETKAKPASRKKKAR